MDRLITVAIHSQSRAVRLKELLENEGIAVTLQNVNLENPSLSAGVRVRIAESDLPLALRIIENTDIFTPDENNIDESKSHYILVPVDCSSHSLKAARVAFFLAERHSAEVLLLHSYLDPYNTPGIQLSDALTFDIAVESEARKQVEDSAKAQLNHFAERLRAMVHSGELPSVNIRTLTVEGVPEDAIVEYAKMNPPYLIVMGTRGASRKADDMIGSVTGEVVDKCRSSILSIPEPFSRYEENGNLRPKNILFFSNLEQEDILALDTMARIYPEGDATVTIVNIPGKLRPFKVNEEKHIQSLIEYCDANFNGFRFKVEKLSLDRSFENFEEIESREKIDLIVVPNKRKNVFARIINHGLPNRILFNADVPMLVIRV